MTVAPIGTRVMTSTPAAMTMSWTPAMTAWAAKWAACCEEPHCRSMVVPTTDSGKPGGEGGIAADVEGLLTHLHDAAHDHVFDEGGIEVVAGDEGPEGFGGEVNRVPVLQLAVPATDGRPDGVDDDGGRHGAAPVVLDHAVKKQC